MTVALHPLWFVHPLLLIVVVEIYALALLGLAAIVFRIVRALRDWVRRTPSPR